MHVISLNRIPRVPRDPLQVRIEGMAEGDEEVLTHRAPHAVEHQRVRPTEHLWMRDPAAEPLASVLVLLPTAFDVYARAEEVHGAEAGRAYRAAADAGARDHRYFVDRMHLDANAVPVSLRDHRGVGEIRLRAQDALGLGEPELGAGTSGVQRHEPADQRGLGRLMVETETARELPPPGQGAAELRPFRLDADFGDVQSRTLQLRCGGILSCCTGGKCSGNRRRNQKSDCADTVRAGAVSQSQY